MEDFSSRMDHIVQLSSPFLHALAHVGEALGMRNLDPDSGHIFVTGGSGILGHRIVAQLMEVGYPHVRAVAHSAEHIRQLKEMGVSDLQRDFAWNDPSTYKASLEGIKTVICIPPHTHDFDKYFEPFLNACIHSGVKHFIKLSFYHARDRSWSKPKDALIDSVHLIRQHGKCDELLVSTLTPHLMDVFTGDPVDISLDVTPARMSYTILYATFFMSNPLIVFHEKLHAGDRLFRNDQPLATFYGCSGNHPVHYVSPNDVSEVAVRVALSPREHYNQEYTLTCDEPIRDTHVADLIGKHLQRPVLYVDQPVHEFESELYTRGEHPDWQIKELVSLERLKKYDQEQAAKGLDDPLFVPTEDIERICQHKPQSFGDYLKDVQHRMTPIERGAEFPSEFRL